MKYIISIVLLFFLTGPAHSTGMDGLPVLGAAPAEDDRLLIDDNGTSKSITTLYLMKILEGALTDFEISSDNLPDALDDGLVTEILVGGGTGVVPVWGTDIPTAVTIGSAYIYRVGGTDVADADVADNITASNYLPLAGGTLTGSVYFDDGDGDSPSNIYVDETGEAIYINKLDGSYFKVWINKATDQEVQFQNAGVGKMNLLVDGYTESDLYRRFNTDKPSGAEIDQVYGADGATWDPASTGLTQNHYVKYVEPPAAECIAEDNPHDCCTAPATGATCEETWLLTEGPDGVTYVSSIELPSYTHHAAADMPYDDEAGGTPYGLTAAEVKGSLISNAGSGEDSVYSLPPAAHGFNFMVMVIDAYQMDLEPDGTETLWLNGTQMAAGEHIQNAADTKGDIMSCVSVESGNNTFEIFCNSSNANWAEATP